MRWRGKVPSVGCACRWDPSSCKLKSDASALAALFQDEAGRRYLHHVDAVTGEVAEFAEDGKTITGGQVGHIRDVVERLDLSSEERRLGKERVRTCRSRWAPYK